MTAECPSADVPAVQEVHAAAERIGPWIHRTPVFTSRTLDEFSGASLFFKCENLQRTGAFKFRGASNAVLCLDRDGAARGVVTHSSGNHAAGVALAARLRRIPAHVVMPANANPVKRAAVAGYGASVHTCEPTMQARRSCVEQIIAKTGATLIHPYDDRNVIAGQGTATLELLEQVDGLDTIVAPIGGGGMLSGACVVASSRAEPLRLIGAQPAGADDAARSLAAGRIIVIDNPSTIADGLRAPICERTFALLQRNAAAVIPVTEAQIIDAMRMVWERLKLIIEPSSAVTLAAVLREPDRFAGCRVGLILTGGNADIDNLPWQQSR